MQLLSQPTLLVAVIEVVIGILLLSRAADEFVEGAATVARAAHVSPIVVGAIIVGFGTSAPELLVSGIAAADGDLDLGLGNIVGSNVANLTLVLGAAALIVPLTVTRALLIREAPLSLISVLVFAYFTTGGLEAWEGYVLLAGLAAALAWIVIGGMNGRRAARAAAAEQASQHSVPVELLRTVLGLIGTVAGAQLLVWGASAIAAEIGLTGGFVGFTLVAVGTSLPELVTAVMAARRGETELILGNLLGSNMFNSLAVGGAISLVGPGPIVDEGLRTIGVVVMVLVAIGAWVTMVTLRRVTRLEAAILLATWLVAVGLLAQNATDGDDGTEARSGALFAGADRGV